jgi:iron donor protein CyaY
MMDNRLYTELADKELNRLFSLLDDINSEDIFEIDILDDMLHIIFRNKKEYIINKHSVTQKLWVASPFSGADYFHYDVDTELWINNKSISIEDIVINEVTDFIEKEYL